LRHSFSAGARLQQAPRPLRETLKRPKFYQQHKPNPSAGTFTENPMKKIFVITTLLGTLMFLSCTKSAGDITPVKGENPGFQDYFIARGQHYSQQTSLVATEYTELRFLVKFDSSAIYNTVTAENQYDINKLYGFSDNNAHHHEFSARIGWRWSDGALRLFGYIYNNGQSSAKELATISIGGEHNCSIRVTDHHYIFSVNGNTTTMPRSSSAASAKGYKLFPYFGGDETAPHDIRIRIKEVFQ
jgi:hypothetical protein